MNDINFLQKGNKRKQAFVNDTFSRIVLNEVFPVLQDVSNDDIHVINYVVFRTKRLIDVIIRYKDLCLPMALDFSINTDLEGSHMRGYRAIYKFHLLIKEDRMKSVLFDRQHESEFNVETFKEFLGDDSLRFNTLYDSYYNAHNCPMQFKQHVAKGCKNGQELKHQISFESQFEYFTDITDTSSYCFSLWNNDIENREEKEWIEDIQYRLMLLKDNISGRFVDMDFWSVIRDNPSMIAEPFRVAIQQHYKVDDYVIPHFDSHIKLFDFFNSEQHRIQAISEMIKI